ncbi:MAG: glycosyltransferase family 9 protein [Selenomonadaceae bacterium]|nr:glycosyltransferase family 9 protein [Selenomonadaceae bacterium]
MEETEKLKVITGAFNKYLQHLIKTRQFIVDEIKDFAEPKFKAAGYRKPPKIGEKLNVLIIHDAAIGDFVLQSGAIREFRRLYPAAHITLMVNAGSLPLAEHCPHVDEIILNEQHYNPIAFNELYEWNLSVAKKLLPRHYHICYAFVHRPNTALLTYMSGAKIRIAHLPEEVLTTFVLGYDANKNRDAFDSNAMLKSTLESFSTKLLSMYTYGGHVVDTHFSFVDHALRAPVANRELELWYNPLDMSNAKNLLEPARRPIYALGMGGREKRKHYPPELYAKLVEKILLEDPEATFVILGGGKADSESAQIFKQNLDEKIFNKHVINLTNKTNYRLSAAILSLCDMYIGNDTGIMHVAAAAKCPVLCPNCFPADLPINRADYVRFFSPYHVPSVTIQPSHAMDSCAVNQPYIQYGCRSHKPHCILHIEVEKVFEGYKILKERIAEKNITPIYIS